MNNLRIEIDLQSEIDASCGTKATTLSELKKQGIAVPDFFAIPSCYFESFCRVSDIQSPELFYSNDNFKAVAKEKFLHVDIMNKDKIVQKIGNGKYMVRSSSVPTNNVDLDMFPSMISGAFESYFASSVYEAVDRITKVWQSAFSEKAYNQCRIFSTTSVIRGIGVLIQRYIEPVISGVAHTKANTVSVNWIEGHLSKIVSGQLLGNSVDAYKSSECNYILRGIEKDILIIKNNRYEDVFKLLLDIITSIKQYFNRDQEVEWIYDGKKVWIIQSQSLIIEK